VARKNIELIRQFVPFYRPYRGLFALDMGTAVLQATLALCIPLLIRNMLKYDLPSGGVARICMVLGQVIVLIALMSAGAYINARWGHVLGQPITAIVPPGDEFLFRLAMEFAMDPRPLSEKEERELKALAATLNPVLQN